MAAEDSQVPAPSEENRAACVECGRSFPDRDMIRFDTYRVCAGCKPVFQQKLAEGSFQPSRMVFAPVSRRFSASILDGILIWFAFFLSGMLFFFLFGSGGIGQVFANLGNGKGTFFSLLLTSVYTIVFLGRLGATPGKLAMGIKVVRADGSPIGMGLATGRYFCSYVSSFTLGIGYLMACFDTEKKTLHDRLCGTRVIRV
jgi:uncharacterized RDD family membrane protein YckC